MTSCRATPRPALPYPEPNSLESVCVKRGLTHQDVLEALTNPFCERGVPVHNRSDNASEFIAKRVRNWIAVKPLFIEPGSPWQYGYIESFNGKMRDEFLAGEIFFSLKEAEVWIEMWRRHYPVPGRCNTVRPHRSLRVQPPAPAAFIAQPSQFQPARLT